MSIQAVTQPNPAIDGWRCQWLVPRWFVWAMVWFGLLCVCTAAAQPTSKAADTASAPAKTAPTQTLRHAKLLGLGAPRYVNLPHKLEPSDFEPQGGLVHYVLRLDLPAVPQEKLGIYVNKLSKSGRVLLNGEEVGACALGALQEIRCLNQPQLFVPPLTSWRAGTNHIEFQIHANRLQPNGLSAVVVGDALTLDTAVFQPALFWRVDMLNMLVWMSLLLGIFSFAIAGLIKGRQLYVWVGMSGVLGALAKASLLQVHPWISVDFFVWTAYASRLVGIPFNLLAILGFFGKQALMRKLQWPLLIYAAFAAATLWFTQVNTTAVSLLYLPLILLAVVLILAMGLWTWQDPKPRHLLITVVVLALVVIGIADWLRFNGVAGFDVLLLMPYASSALVLVFYTVVLSMVGQALKASQTQEQVLNQKVAERTQALEAVHRQLTAIQVEQAAQAERERLLQDIHDGFGSQLSSARLMVAQGELDKAGIHRLLSECMSDLHLVADTLGSSHKTLAVALADLRHRTERRTAELALTWHWHLELEGMPALSERSMLQLLRVGQEAINNVLKHAQARHVWVEASFDRVQMCLRLRIQDDGVGMAGVVTAGRGQHNMRQRARELDAELTFLTLKPGTLVMLVWKVSEG